MSGIPLQLRPVFGCLLASLSAVAASPAVAQWNPVGSQCYCAQPIVQSCYRTVPITEYREVKQTVSRPVIETKYVEQPVTEYQPIVETRTAEVPVTTYQDITEQQVVQQNQSYWVTRHHPIPRISACEYDNRPNLMGWINRAGYTLRTALAPRYRTTWDHVPQIVEQTIPITRRIPIQETRKVTYNVTRYEPRTASRKVAVNTVRYVNEERTVLQPVTVMRTVPIGSAIAYSYAPAVVSRQPQTALLPSPDPIGASRSAEVRGQSPPTSSARAPEPRQQPQQGPRSSQNLRNDRENGTTWVNPSRNRTMESPRSDTRPAEAVPTSMPSMVRVGAWRSRTTSTGPVVVTPTVNVASNR